MEIRVDDLTGPEIAKLLQNHLQHLSSISPPESMHALNLDALRKPEITFWSVWDTNELLGCGALKELSAEHAEIKSMRTDSAHLRKGVASHLLQHIIHEAKKRKYSRLSLETGAGKIFEPAHRLYAKFDFKPCGPFGDYREDPNSLFLTREI